MTPKAIVFNDSTVRMVPAVEHLAALLFSGRLLRLRKRRAKVSGVHAFVGVLREVRQCASTNNMCRNCRTLERCVEWWDAVAVEVQDEQQAIDAVAEFRRLSAGEEALYGGDKHLGQPPHKSHRKRQQDDPLEESALSAVQEAVIP